VFRILIALLAAMLRRWLRAAGVGAVVRGQGGVTEGLDQIP
jgi:hypothetical protein